MVDRGISFTEQEVARILWVLAESVELAGQIDALSSRAMFEEVLRMVLLRFNERGGE